MQMWVQKDIFVKGASICCNCMVLLHQRNGCTCICRLAKQKDLEELNGTRGKAKGIFHILQSYAQLFVSQSSGVQWHLLLNKHWSRSSSLFPLPQPNALPSRGQESLPSQMQPIHTHSHIQTYTFSPHFSCSKAVRYSMQQFDPLSSESYGKQEREEEADGLVLGCCICSCFLEQDLWS